MAFWIQWNSAGPMCSASRALRMAAVISALRVMAFFTSCQPPFSFPLAASCSLSQPA